MSPEVLWIACGIAALGALLLGLGSLVRYARTRQVLFLIAGMMLSYGLGVAFLYYLDSQVKHVFDKMAVQIDGPWPTP